MKKFIRNDGKKFNRRSDSSSNNKRFSKDNDSHNSFNRRDSSDRSPRRDSGSRFSRGRDSDRPPRRDSVSRVSRGRDSDRPPRRDSGSRFSRGRDSDRPPRRDSGRRFGGRDSERSSGRDSGSRFSRGRDSDRPPRRDSGSRFSRGRDSDRSSGRDSGNRFSRGRDSDRSSGRDSGRRFGGRGNDWGVDKRKRERPGKEMHDVVCCRCGKNCQVPFKPQRPDVFCNDCFDDSKTPKGDQRQFSRRNFREGKGKSMDEGALKKRRRDKEMFKVLCCKCGKECEVPFKPKKPDVYCDDCFGDKKKRESKKRYPGREKPIPTEASFDAYMKSKEGHPIMCYECGEVGKIPFKPSKSKPALCDKCYRKSKKRL